MKNALTGFFAVFFAASLFAPALPAPEPVLPNDSSRFPSTWPLPSVDPFSGVKPEVGLQSSTRSLVWQNIKLDLEEISRIQNDEELYESISSGTLVPIPFNQCLKPHPKWDEKWHFVLAQAAEFLEDINKKICGEFAFPVQINGAVRHIPRQLELIAVNPNAVPVSGDRASPHLTGAAVDIAVLGFPKEMVKRITDIAIEFERAGLLEATLETKAQNVLHVTVFREYAQRRIPPTQPIANVQ